MGQPRTHSREHETTATYGTHAKATSPELEKLANDFEQVGLDFSKHLMLMKAKCVGETFAAIQSAIEAPSLRTIR